MEKNTCPRYSQKALYFWIDEIDKISYFLYLITLTKIIFIQAFKIIKKIFFAKPSKDI
jgi:hypothetical protein